MIIAQGAEAILRKEGNLLIKERVSKNYRLQQIDDKLRTSRTKKEAKTLALVETIIPVPKVHKVDNKTKTITMDYIEGAILRDVISTIHRKKVFHEIGHSIKKLHDANIIHGDLTTSNMIIREGTVYFIDFGLSTTSIKIEDRAVDLRLFKQALDSKHSEHAEECFKALLQGYNPDKEFNARFNKVESRGRYKKKQQV